MTLLVIFILITSAAIILVVLSTRKRKWNTGNVLPEQELIVRELLRELNDAVFKVRPPEKVHDKKPQRFTLQMIKDLSEKDEELAGEEFEDDRIFFSKEMQLIPLTKYMENEHLPRQILYELSHFYNSRFISAKTDDLHYFTIVSLYRDSGKSEIVEGSGEAFETWQTFQKCTHNLFNAIYQWLEVNTSSEKNRVQAQARVTSF